MAIRINRDPSRRDLRLFAGVWLPLFAALAGGVSYWNGHHAQALAVWGAGAALTVGGLASLRFARLVFLALSYLTFPIGYVVSYAVLAAVFYVVVTPIALVLRARGRDPLQLKRPSGSMWTPRQGHAGPERHFRQY